MLPYWLVFSSFALCSLSGHRRRTANFSIFLLLAAVVLTLFIGLRFEVGADWTGYLSIFNYTKKMSFERIIEAGSDPGFYSLVWITHQMGLEIWGLNLFCALIFVWGLIAFSRRTPNAWLSLTIAFPYLVIVVAMSGMRQATAIGFYFLALNAFSGRRLVTAAFFMTVASLFHASAIIMLGIAALSFARDKLKMLGILGITIAVGYFALSSSLEVYAARYSKDLQSGGTIFRLVMNLLPAIIFLKFKNSFGLERHELILWQNLSFLSILSFPLLFVIPSSTALDRFSLYLIPLQCFVLSGAHLLLANNSREEKMVVLAILAYLATAMFVFLNFSATTEAWNNYQLYPFADVGARPILPR